MSKNSQRVSSYYNLGLKHGREEGKARSFVHFNCRSAYAIYTEGVRDGVVSLRLEAKSGGKPYALMIILFLSMTFYLLMFFGSL